MSGIHGIIDTRNSTDIPAFLQKASTALSHLPWYSTDEWAAEDVPVGLGRVGIGIFNTEPQPVMSADSQHVLLMCGELYNGVALRREHGLEGRTDPELALAAYQAYGPDFARKLNGAFFIAIFDQQHQQLLLTCDRFGLYPHYYFQRDGRLVFASEIKGVLCADFVPRQLDVTAAAEYFRFQHPLGDKTFHQDIKLFPYGSFARFDLGSGDWSLQHYWDWDQIPYRPEVGFEEAVEEAGRLLRQSVERLTTGELRPGVFLSGGLDSRTLLGYIPARTPPPVSATFGIPNSRDAYYAGRIASVVGSHHESFDMSDGRWVTDHVDLHLTLTEGFHSWIHMHGIHMLGRLRHIMDYNLTGWDGGTIMGHPDQISPTLTAPVDQDALLVDMFKQYVNAYTWPSITEAEERLLYTDAFAKQGIGLAFESMRTELNPYWQKYRREYAAEYFYLFNHCLRMTIHMVTITRSHMETRFPFWDYELLDFVYSLRPEIRQDQLMYREIITRHLPQLAVIPYDKQEVLPTTSPLRHNAQAISMRVRRRLGLFPQRPTLYADYENYLRHELRGWAESILFDKCTEERGILNMPFVKSLMARHVSGNELWTIGKIAPLITFEMLMRRYFD